MTEQRNPSSQPHGPGETHAADQPRLPEPRVGGTGGHERAVMERDAKSQPYGPGHTHANPQPRMPMPRQVGHDGSGGDTKAAERPRVPAPAVLHGHTPTKGLKNIKRSNPSYGRRR